MKRGIECTKHMAADPTEFRQSCVRCNLVLVTTLSEPSQAPLEQRPFWPGQIVYTDGSIASLMPIGEVRQCKL